MIGAIQIPDAIEATGSELRRLARGLAVAAEGVQGVTATMGPVQFLV
ncbi:hypothetical protein [Streptomyces sp. 6N106]